VFLSEEIQESKDFEVLLPEIFEDLND